MSKYQQLLKQYWGYDSFRGIQREIIDSICSGRDTLGLMPTGGGKSITFQIPALASEGICIVITPLIALMKDQVDHLRKRGIKAAAIYTGMSQEKVLTTFDNCLYGDYKLLYISPERIGSEFFQTKLRHMRVSFICVDEAHCISQWGHDFRQSYLEIKQIRKLVPQAPILALTATATPKVVGDIQHELMFRAENVFRMSFERKNLAYIVREASDKERDLKEILNQNSGSTIIYMRTRRACVECAKLLTDAGYSATFYHAGLSTVEKDERQNDWQKDKIRIMVATNAFGMGIDKPDVRLVIHLSPPTEIETYFQEAGRAGRDGLPSKAIMLYTSRDIGKLKEKVSKHFPDKQHIRKIYENVCCYLQVSIGNGAGTRREFNLIDFCQKFTEHPSIVENSLRLLTKAGYLNYTDAEEGTSRLMFSVTREELYHIQEPDNTTENLFKAIFRRYSGLFSQYQNIDEAYLASATGLTAEQVYNKLKELTKRRILSYIPRKNIPHIAFPRERMATDDIHIPPTIYEHRKQEMLERVEAISEYITEDDQCRSAYLLSYFGESANHDCGICDICVDNQSPHPFKALLNKIGNAITGKPSEEEQRREEQRREVKANIIAQLQEAGSIHPFMLNFDNIDIALAQEVIKQMSDDGEIVTDDTFRISLRKS